MIVSLPSPLAWHLSPTASASPSWTKKSNPHRKSSVVPELDWKNYSYELLCKRTCKRSCTATARGLFPEQPLISFVQPPTINRCPAFFKTTLHRQVWLKSSSKIPAVFFRPQHSGCKQLDSEMTKSHEQHSSAEPRHTGKTNPGDSLT